MMYAPFMAGVARAITLTDDEGAQLTAWTRQGTTEQRMAQRARMVLEAAAGKPTKEIASRWGLRPATVSKWRTRFAKARLAGLADSPRSGKPPVYGEETERRILAKLDEPPPEGHSSWTGSLVAQMLGDVSEAQVWRVLRRYGIHLQRRRSWCVSTDPQFAQKAADIVGMYLGPTGQRGGDKRGREARYPGPGAGPRMAEAAQWRGAARAYPRVQAAWDDDLVRGFGGPYRDRSRGPLPPAPTPGVPRLYEPAGGPVPGHRTARRPG